MVVLGSITIASGQSAPSFRSSAPIPLTDGSPNAAETAPPSEPQNELFGNVPLSRADAPRMPRLPRSTQRLPGTVQPFPGPAPLPARGTTPDGPASRAPETPVAFQRHPGRNLSSPEGDAAFTFRATSAAEVLAQLSVGIQSDIWHTDNLTDTIRNRAVGDVVLDLRPIVKLNLGSLPTSFAAGTPRSEYFLELLYTPTQQTLVNTGTSRMLQRVSGEIGRSSPVLMSAVRFEYDENIAAFRGDGTSEDRGTFTEIAPVLDYSLTPKTTLHAEGAWRRIVSQGSGNNRSEYVLNAAVATVRSPKTTLGAGFEFGHIPFDRAQSGSQNYEQAYATMAWQATPKVRFLTRAGIEVREFDRPIPKPARVTPVASLIVNWVPNENTQINGSFRVQDRPSVTRAGAIFREVRFGTDGRYQIGRNFYLSSEVALIQRNYDNGIREFEADLRHAFGFRTDKSRIFDSLNFEIYHQYRRVDSNQPREDRDRNIFGVETTVHF